MRATKAEVEAVNRTMFRVCKLLRWANGLDELAHIIDTCSELRECMKQLRRSERLFSILRFDTKEWMEQDEWEVRRHILGRLFHMVRYGTATDMMKMLQLPRRCETVPAPRPIDTFYSYVLWLLGE
jgi:hypothetical protein